MNGAFFLHKVCNEGWIVERQSTPDHPYRHGQILGAFSNTDDLLDWLTKELPKVPVPKVLLDEPAARP